MADDSLLGPRLNEADLAKRQQSRKPTADELTDGDVKLAPYDETVHLNALFRLFSSAPSVFTFLGTAAASASTIDDTRSWIHTYADMPDCQTFVIFVSPTAYGSDAAPSASSEWQIAGTTSYLAHRPHDLVVEIGNVAGAVKTQERKRVRHILLDGPRCACVFFGT
jgi:hypothetical protein